MGYIYFMWFTVLFLLFVLLPIDKSYFKIFNKEPAPTKFNDVTSGLGGRPDGRQWYVISLILFFKNNIKN